MNELWTAELLRLGANFNDGRIADFGDARGELGAIAGGPVICDLSHEGLILAAGDDAAGFLQGQFSNDVLALAEGGVQWNSWSSPKGRMLVSLLVWKGTQGWFLQLPRGLLGAIQKRLQMYVLRAKVKLEDVSATWVRFGLAAHSVDALEANIRAVFGDIPGAAMESVHADGARLIRLSANRFEIIARPERGIALWAAFTTGSGAGGGARPVGAAVWDGLAIREGIITILAETQESFVAQMANFELIGGVNFRKGCYAGQEIVARTQYRGILKKRMVRIHGDLVAGEALPMPGASVYAAEFGEQSAGVIANVAPVAEGGFEALVVAQLDSIRANSLRRDRPDGPLLDILDLPYAIPEIDTAAKAG
jgi:folate-binding protein YgfZ